MKSRFHIAGVLLALAGTAFLGACTQMPTEKQSVADIRPQISFRIERQDLARAQVRVNGLNMGLAGDYPSDRAALRLIAGTHQLQVLWQNQIVLDERFYVADGVSKTFVLK